MNPAQEEFGLLALTNQMGALVAMALLTSLKAFSPSLIVL
jgi:hypothetical protein